MAISSEQYQQLIKDELKILDNATLDGNIPLYWEMYSEKSDPIRYLWTKHRVLGFLLGQYRTNVDKTIGQDQIRAQQRFANVRSMYEINLSELQRQDPDFDSSESDTLHTSTPYAYLTGESNNPYGYGYDYSCGDTKPWMQKN